jgi:hypothetical protein
MRSILRVSTATRQSTIEGHYRTEDQQIRAYRRLLGDNTTPGVSFLMGQMIQVTDPGVCTMEGTIHFLSAIQCSGGLAISPPQGSEILDTVKVLVLGNLEMVERAILSKVPRAIIDRLEGSLPHREHVRESSTLPDGKYEARKKKEEDRLALLSVRESLTFSDAVKRAGEVLRERPYLQTEIAVVIGAWRPRKF